MATVIRMQRGGRTHAPYYRMVVMDSRRRARGRVIDSLGVYQPCAQPKPLVELDLDRVRDWLARGARMTDTVRNVLSREGLLTASGKGKAAAGEPESGDALS